MSMPKNVGGRDRLVRGVLAAVLTVIAIRTLKNGKRRTAVLAAVGALVESGMGYDQVFGGFAVLLAGFLVGLGVAARLGKLPS